MLSTKLTGFISGIRKCVLEIGRGLLRQVGFYETCPSSVKHILPDGRVVSCAIINHPFHQAFNGHPYTSQSQHDSKFLNRCIEDFEKWDAKALAEMHGLVQDNSDVRFLAPYILEKGVVKYRKTGYPVPEGDVIRLAKD